MCNQGMPKRAEIKTSAAAENAQLVYANVRWASRFFIWFLTRAGSRSKVLYKIVGHTRQTVNLSFQRPSGLGRKRQGCDCRTPARTRQPRAPPSCRIVAVQRSLGDVDVALQKSDARIA